MAYFVLEDEGLLAVEPLHKSYRFALLAQSDPLHKHPSVALHFLEVSVGPRHAALQVSSRILHVNDFRIDEESPVHSHKCPYWVVCFDLDVRNC